MLFFILIVIFVPYPLIYDWIKIEWVIGASLKKSKNEVEKRNLFFSFPKAKKELGKLKDRFTAEYTTNKYTKNKITWV